MSSDYTSLPNNILFCPSIKNESSQLSTVNKLEFPKRIKSILSLEKLLCVQTVEPEESGAQFSLINADTTKIMAEIEVEVSGLIPKLFTEKVLLVVAYSSESNPDVTDIYAVDWQTGEIIWERPMTKILEANHLSLKIPHRNFQDRFVFLDVETGDEIDSLREAEAHSSHIKYPSGYLESSVYFEWFAKFLKAQSKTPVKHCEYIRLPKQTVLSYYLQHSDTLSNELVVIDIHGKILDEFLLESELKGIGKDTFFIFEDQLVFITNQKTLNFYAL